MIKRTPPPSPAISIPSASTSNLDETQNITHRKKTDSSDQMKSFMNEMRTMFMEFQDKQKAEFCSLYTAISEIRTQNIEIQQSIEFLSKKYDDVVTEISGIKSDIDKNVKCIQELEMKLEGMERAALSSTVEIRNVPKASPENTSTLIELIQKAGNTLNCSINKSDIRNIYRQKQKNESQGPIVVNFSANHKKEEFIKLARDYNKLNTVEKLNTSHMGISGPTKPVYISERLTYKSNRIFFLARALSKEKKYHHCWTFNGQIYLRKKDGDSPLRLVNEEDIAKLKTEN